MCAALLLGQQQAPPASPPEDLPVSLDRIQRALSTKPAIELKEQHPVFRLEIFGSKPTLEDILGEKFWLGPSKYGSMTHQEFLDKVNRLGGIAHRTVSDLHALARGIQAQFRGYYT